MMQMRDFRINVNQDFRDPDQSRFMNNNVKTCKYSIITFLPLNILV